MNNWEMDNELQKRNLCIPYNVVLKTVQQSGLVGEHIFSLQHWLTSLNCLAVACHGSGAGFGSYSDWIVSMDIIDWTGSFSSCGSMTLF